MVLRPLEQPAQHKESLSAEPVPAWTAVAARQSRAAPSWWLISQPDHAALSGDLAANFVSPLFPRLDPLVVRSIGVHDSGWSIFPAESSLGPQPLLNTAGKPLSFIEFSPWDFLRAWKGSIERAESIAPVGGIIVSRHFCGLAEFRIRTSKDPDTDRRAIRHFLECEKARQQRLSEQCALDPAELNKLVQVLQFCDLLSLYLCCGADEFVEFPQPISSRPVRVSRDGGDFYRLDPSPFQIAAESARPVSLGVKARLYPAVGAVKTTTLAFLLW
ncbi:MAG: DUF3891 family protein [Terriglobales bacterium]